MLGSAGEGTAAVGETHDGPRDTAGNDTRQALEFVVCLLIALFY